MKITGRLADSCPHGHDCPRIHDTDGDEVIVQGPTLTDPDMLAHLDMPTHESAVKVPRSLIYPEPMTLREMGQWIGERHTFHLLRVENRDHYTSGSDGGDFQRFLRGEAEPLEGRAWQQAIAADTLQGRTWAKAHIQRGAPSEYEQYAYSWGFAHTVPAGEQVRIVEAHPHELAAVPDFFVIDREHVVRSIYDEVGHHIGAQVVVGIDALVYRALAEMIWNRGVPFVPWWSDHPDYHRKPRAA